MPIIVVDLSKELWAGYVQRNRGRTSLGLCRTRLGRKALERAAEARALVWRRLSAVDAPSYLTVQFLLESTLVDLDRVTGTNKRRRETLQNAVSTLEDHRVTVPYLCVWRKVLAQTRDLASKPKDDTVLCQLQKLESGFPSVLGQT